MNRPLKTALLLAALALLALVATVSPAAAKSKPDCWKVLMNDWYDGTISGKYDLHCYREALDHLSGSDIENYTSARDDIRRALNRRITEIAAAKKKPTAKPVAPKTDTTETTTNGNSSGPTGSSGPSDPPPSAVVPPRKNGGKTTKHGNGNSSSTKPTGPKAVGGAPSPTTTNQEPTTPGRDKGKGPATHVLNQLGPGDATSLPIPLLVLAGLAVLLMGTGAATLIAKRAQARRVATVPVRSSD